MKKGEIKAKTSSEVRVSLLTAIVPPITITKRTNITIVNILAALGWEERSYSGEGKR